MRYRRVVDRRAIDLWWLKPAWLVVLIVVPVYLSFIVFDFENVVPRRYIPGPNYWWGLLLLATLALGATLGSYGAAKKARITARREVSGIAAAAQIRIPAALTGALLVLTLLAYAVWFGPLLTAPDAILQVFRGERDNVRDLVETMPGITTFTQCGAAYAVLYAIKRYAGSESPQMWERLGLALVFALALARAFLWSERLALLEVMVAYGIATAAFYRFRSRGMERLAVALPLVAPTLLYLAFTGTEYFRSWRFYQDYYDSIWQFSYERLVTYYAVASNSGIGLLEELRDWPQYTGRFVFEWAYVFPYIGPALIDAFGDAHLGYSRFLLEYGRQEFNNPSGIFVIVYDIGYFGSALYFLAAGLLIGLGWKSFYLRRPGGLLFFPFCFLFVIELLRFNYFAASRFVPIAVSLLLAYGAIKGWRGSRPRPAPRWSPPLQRREI